MNPQDFLTQAAHLAVQIDPHKTSPNPRVGCLIVKNGKFISQGVHEFFGGPHAEINAIKNVSTALPQSLSPGGELERGVLENSEIYITLEPCHHFDGKKTPSCAELLLKAKPKKIWVGALDPQFQGKNIEYLKSKGLDIEYLPNKNCEALNPFFKTWITKQKPYITLKIAQSLDGKITSKTKYITNELSRQKVHEMRSQYSTILTTTETVLQDDPLLDCRLKKGSNPQIIILGKRKIPKTAKIFTIANRKLHFLASLDDLQEFCSKNNIDSLMTECGGNLNTQLLEKDLVDEIQLFIAPFFLGNKEKSSFLPLFTKEGAGGCSKNTGISLKNFHLQKTKNLEGDLWLKYKREHYSAGTCARASS